MRDFSRFQNESPFSVDGKLELPRLLGAHEALIAQVIALLGVALVASHFAPCPIGEVRSLEQAARWGILLAVVVVVPVAVTAAILTRVQIWVAAGLLRVERQFLFLRTTRYWRVDEISGVRVGPSWVRWNWGRVPGVWLDFHGGGSYGFVIADASQANEIAESLSARLVSHAPGRPSDWPSAWRDAAKCEFRATADGWAVDFQPLIWSPSALATASVCAAPACIATSLWIVTDETECLIALRSWWLGAASAIVSIVGWYLFAEAMAIPCRTQTLSTDGRRLRVIERGLLRRKDREFDIGQLKSVDVGLGRTLPPPTVYWPNLVFRFVDGRVRTCFPFRDEESLFLVCFRINELSSSLADDHSHHIDPHRKTSAPDTAGRDREGKT